MQTMEKPYSAGRQLDGSVSPTDLRVVPPSQRPGSQQPKRLSMSAASALKLPSERRFGLMLTVAFCLLGSYGVIRHRSWIANVICLAAGAVFGLATLVMPRVLAPLNRAWFHLGEFLGKIVSPIIMGIIFFGILTPISLLTRLAGRDELRLQRHARDSYWIDRPPADSATQSFKNQF